MVAVPVQGPEVMKHPHATPVVGRDTVASGGGGGRSGSGSSSGAGMRPPRSPLKQPKKACVPTLEDALDDVQV